MTGVTGTGGWINRRWRDVRQSGASGTYGCTAVNCYGPFTVCACV